MINFESKEKYGVYDLVALVRALRGPKGCPWDREQTHESIRRNFIEETYEAVEAIDNGDKESLLEELGDVLSQVVFHTEMETEQGGFTLDDVADGVCKKYIFRHPHVFGTDKLSTADEVLVKWEEMKRLEKSQKTTTDAMDSVAKTLPSLIRAEKIGAKASKAGFHWQDADAALDAVERELNEVRTASPESVGEEFGDLLFAVVRAAKFFDVQCEESLSSACDKFTNRFRIVEELSGGNLNDKTPEELNELWNRAKQSI